MDTKRDTKRHENGTRMDETEWHNNILKTGQDKTCASSDSLGAETWRFVTI